MYALSCYLSTLLIYTKVANMTADEMHSVYDTILILDFGSQVGCARDKAGASRERDVKAEIP
jgi:hypothetical protein